MDDQPPSRCAYGELIELIEDAQRNSRALVRSANCVAEYHHQSGRYDAYSHVLELVELLQEET